MLLVGCIIRIWNNVNNNSLRVVLRKEMTSKITQTVRLANKATKASTRAIRHCFQNNVACIDNYECDYNLTPFVRKCAVLTVCNDGNYRK